MWIFIIFLCNLLFSQNIILEEKEIIYQRDIAKVEVWELEKFFSLNDGVFMEKKGEKYHWDIAKMYPSLKDWHISFQKIDEGSLNNVSRYKGKLKDSSKNILWTLEKYFAMYRKLENLYTFSRLLLDQDLSNDQSKEICGMAISKISEFQAKTSWIESEILQIDKKNLLEYIKDPSFKEYQFYFEKLIRIKPHILSSAQEEIIARFAETFQAPYNTFSCFNNADLIFGKIKDSSSKEYDLTHGSYNVYLRSKDRTLRKEAFQKLHKKFLDFENTLAELLNSKVKEHVILSKTRNYEDSLQSVLYPKAIEKDVYYNLIATVKENIAVLHKFVRLKKKLLNISEIYSYDLYAPIYEEKMDFDVKDSIEKVISSVEILGKEYQEILRNGLTKNRWVDFYEKNKKRSGAYSSGCYDSMPYILMNYHGNLNDLLTLAHEAGHSMHSYLSNKNQLYHNSFYPIFLGEIASTFNEQLLFDYLFNSIKNPQKKKMLLLHKLDAIHATFFRQVLFADFELKIHNLVEKGKPLTPKILKEIYKNLYREYYGEDLSLDEYIDIEWARIPHFYYNFYVYQYATGISAAICLHEGIKKDKNNCQKYLKFLKSGGSRYPLELLKEAGVDLTKPEPILSLIRYFDGLLNKLDQ